MAIVEVCKNAADAGRLACARLTLKYHWLAWTTDIQKNLVVIWRSDKREFGQTFSHEHFFEEQGSSG
jgi:hypothetical protein